MVLCFEFEVVLECHKGYSFHNGGEVKYLYPSIVMYSCCSHWQDHESFDELQN